MTTKRIGSGPGGGRPAGLRGAVALPWILLALLLALPPGRGAEAQSLTGTTGLGFPLEPIDARARGMGSLGVGLFGPSLLPGDPAVAQALTVPMVTATYQPSWASGSLGSEAVDHRTSRFPLLGIAYPVGGTGGMATLTFSGFMDQNWEVTDSRTLDLAGATVPATDSYRSEGGISALRLGWAQRVRPGLSVAATLGSYIGGVTRVFTRSFDSTAVGADVQSYRNGGEWQFTGPTASAGVSWDATDLVRVAGSVTWSGELHADATPETEAPDQDFELPLEYRLGASGELSSRLSVNLGLSYADWSATNDDLGDGAASGGTWSYGGGVEWDGPNWTGRDFPLRIGYRQSELPFRFLGSEVSESVWALGVGLQLLQLEELPLARFDLAYERGDRDGGPLSESFDRLTLTLRVAGR